MICYKEYKDKIYEIFIYNCCGWLSKNEKINRYK